MTVSQTMKLEPILEIPVPPASPELTLPEQSSAAWRNVLELPRSAMAMGAGMIAVANSLILNKEIARSVFVAYNLEFVNRQSSTTAAVAACAVAGTWAINKARSTFRS